MANALYAVGRSSESLAAQDLALQLGNNFAKWDIGAVNLVEKRDETAIAHFEAWLQQHNYPDSTWVRELVTGARDPATGQAYLDRRIPQIIASMPQYHSYIGWVLTLWYQLFGFPDRYFEIILATDPADWTGTHIHVQVGITFRRLGFTAHPKYLEVAEPLGIVEVWEQRGPPDFCEKVDGQWVCE